MEMRRFLRVTGFLTMTLGKRAIHIDELQSRLERVGLTSEAVEKSENYEAQQTFLAMAFRKTGESSWEFKHKSFGEYLAAEYIAEDLDRAISKKEDPDLPDQFLWDKKDDEVATSWIDLFASSGLAPEVQLFLEPMLGRWRPFVRGEGYRANPEGLPDLLNRCGMMYTRIIKERDVEKLTYNAREMKVDPTMAVANVETAILALGCYCARTLSTPEEEVYFEIEKLAPHGWTKMLSLVRQSVDLSNAAVAERLFKGISLANGAGIVLPGQFFPGLFLPFVRITGIQADRAAGRIGHDYDVSSSFDDRAMTLNSTIRNLSSLTVRAISSLTLSAVPISSPIPGRLSDRFLSFSRLLGRRSSRGVQLPAAVLHGSDLSGINLQGAQLVYSFLGRSDFSSANLEGVDFTGSRLFEADFRGARMHLCVLRGCVLKNANLTGADLTDADLTRADLRGAQLAKADLTNVDLTGADLRGSDLTEATLRNATMTGARLNNANFADADLSDTNLELVDVSGARNWPLPPSNS